MKKFGWLRGAVALCLVLACLMGTVAVPVFAEETGYADVGAGSWYAPAVTALLADDILTPGAAFEPNRSATRAELVELLFKLSAAYGYEPNPVAPAAFLDMPEDETLTGYIGWANSEGIVAGYSNTRFGTNDSITRQDTAVILKNYITGYLNLAMPSSLPLDFADAGSVATYARDAVAYAAHTGLMVGFEDGRFGPSDLLPRSQAAQVVYNVIRKLVSLAVPRTELKSGPISGRYNGDIAVYKGIPYAAPPVGELRWKAPQSVEPWTELRACTEWGYSAIQTPQAPFMMWSTEFIIEDTGYSEDCLTLNVWSKEDGVSGKPVIVFIHGGGFTSGGSSCEVYDGSYMAGQGAVFVNINYRVGVLGFLAHPELSAESEHGVSGNYAILDQIAALQWVQDNAAAFGGDPSNVTVMGQSAGSGSVEYLISSPLAAGLFDKAVTMSFNSITGSGVSLADREATGKETFGDRTLAEMRAMTTEELMALSFAGSGGTVDGYVLKAGYRESLEKGYANDVTLMSGMVVGDAMLFGSATADSLEAYAALAETRYGEHGLADEFLAAYPAEADTLAASLELINDHGMMAAQNLIVQTRKAAGTERDSYLYLLTHVMPGPNAAAFGAFHTSDVPYFFNIFSNLRYQYWTEEDYTMGDTMSGYLLNFAKTGNPNGGELPVWNASEGKYSWQELRLPCEEAEMTEAQAAFWDAYYKALGLI